MASLSGFNANNVDPSVGFEPLPKAKYLACIVDSGFEANKKGTGSFLKLTFQIIEGQYQKRKLFSRLNLDNPNPEAVRIAQGELSAICRAVGVMTPNDSTELHDKPLLIDVHCKKSDDGEIRNEIKGYLKREAVMAGAGTGNNGANTPSVGVKPPWQK